MNAPDPRRLLVFDTTLRDGDQAALFSFGIEEKRLIGKALASLGVDIIEAGFPSSSKIDLEACRLLCRELAIHDRKPLVSLMCRAKPEEIEFTSRVFHEPSRSVLHITLPVSDLHRETKLGISRIELLSRARSAVSAAASLAPFVEMGAEDAFRADKAFLAEYCAAVTAAGATTVNIADTVGSARPDQVTDLVSFLLSEVDAFRSGQAVLSIHCHNDRSLAVANTLAAVSAGAGQIEVSMHGVGERAGNAALEEVLTNLLKNGDYYRVNTHISLERLGDAVRFVSSACGTGFSPIKPVTGSNIDAHASGIHQQGISRNPLTYRSVTLETTALIPPRIVLSRHSGRAGVALYLEEHTGSAPTEEMISRTLDLIKSSPLEMGLTEVFAFLRARGQYLGRLLECEAYEEAWDGKAFSIRATLKISDKECPLSLTAGGPSRSAAFRDILIAAGGSTLTARTVSVTGYADKCRVYAELVTETGVIIPVERRGPHEGLLLFQCFLDAANSRSSNLHQAR